MGKRPLSPERSPDPKPRLPPISGKNGTWAHPRFHRRGQSGWGTAVGASPFMACGVVPPACGNIPLTGAAPGAAIRAPYSVRRARHGRDLCGCHPRTTPAAIPRSPRNPGANRRNRARRRFPPPQPTTGPKPSPRGPPRTGSSRLHRAGGCRRVRAGLAFFSVISVPPCSPC